jgi:hypothetical protein
MASLPLPLKQGHALRHLLFELATCTHLAAVLPGFQTIDGEMVPHGAAEQALESGAAVLIGGLLVGTVSLSIEID